MVKLGSFSDSKSCRIEFSGLEQCCSPQGHYCLGLEVPRSGPEKVLVLLQKSGVLILRQKSCDFQDL